MGTAFSLFILQQAILTLLCVLARIVQELALACLPHPNFPHLSLSIIVTVEYYCPSSQIFFFDAALEEHHMIQA